MIKNPEIQSFIDKINPPYKKNIDARYFLASQNENARTFSSRIDGLAPLPSSEKDIEELAQTITENISNIYLPRVENYMQIKPELVSDIIRSPENYKYPFLSAIYAIKKNSIAASLEIKKSLLTKSISGDKKFDENIFESLLIRN